MITIILIVLAAICKAVMDTLNFHFDSSIFKKLNPKSWDHSISCNNKWKNGNKSEGEKFFGSSTFLVFLTDAWHLFQHLFLIFIFITIVIYKPLINPLIDFFMLYLIFTLTFELFFGYILINKK